MNISMSEDIIVSLSLTDKEHGENLTLIQDATRFNTSTNGFNWSEGLVQRNATSLDPDPASTESIVLMSLMFIVIGCTGLFGNFLVIVVILVDRKMRNSVTNIFIMNLAIADFLIMLFGIPEIVQFMLNTGWLIGEVMCKVNRFILVVSLYVSILSLVTVCIER